MHEPALEIPSMTTPSDTPDWRSMSQQERDLGLNNGVHVPASADLVAGWDRRSQREAGAIFRSSRPAIWPARAQPDRFLQGRRQGADAALHPRRLLANPRQGDLCAVFRRPDGAWHQCRADRLHAGAGRDARSDRGRNPCRDRLSRRHNCPRSAATATGSWWPAGPPAAISPRWRCRTRMCERGWRYRASTISSRSGTAISTSNSGSMKRPRAATRR